MEWHKVNARDICSVFWYNPTLGSNRLAEFAFSENYSSRPFNRKNFIIGISNPIRHWCTFLDDSWKVVIVLGGYTAGMVVSSIWWRLLSLGRSLGKWSLRSSSSPREISFCANVTRSRRDIDGAPYYDALAAKQGECAALLPCNRVSGFQGLRAIGGWFISYRSSIPVTFLALSSIFFQQS